MEVRTVGALGQDFGGGPFSDAIDNLINQGLNQLQPQTPHIDPGGGGGGGGVTPPTPPQPTTQTSSTNWLLVGALAVGAWFAVKWYKKKRRRR